jgi:hypothetical protein
MKGKRNSRKPTKLVLVISLRDGIVGLEGSEVVNIETNGLTISLLSSTLASLLTLVLRLLERLLVDGESELLGHEHGQVDGESVGVVEAPDIGSRELLGSRSVGSLDVGLEELLSAVEGARERLLLLVEDLLEVVVLASDLGEEGTL